MKTEVRALRPIFPDGYIKACIFSLNPTLLLQEHNYIFWHITFCFSDGKEIWYSDLENAVVEGIWVRLGPFRSPHVLITVYLCFCLWCLTILSPAGHNHLSEHTESTEKNILAGEYVRCWSFRTLRTTCQNFSVAEIHRKKLPSTWVKLLREQE